MVEKLTADIVVVGSGAAGATAAMVLAEAGVRVVLLEEGPELRPADMAADSFGAMSTMYRDLGGVLIGGSTYMPAVQGRVVGGSTVFNGGICWRMPADVYEEWRAREPALGERLPYAEIVAKQERIERDLGVAPTDAAIAGPKNALMARGAAALGLEGRPIARNVRGCEGLGRCLQGCPRDHKLGMDRTYVPRAVAAGARLLADCRAERIVTAGGSARGVRARFVGGPRAGSEVEVAAARGVVLAASALQTPLLLMTSGIRGGPVGENFRCHPGVSMAGWFPEEVRNWEGATQGYEVTGLRHRGLKFETLGFGAEITAGRLKGVGHALAADLGGLAHWANWGAALKARGVGRVRPGLFGAPRVSFRFTPEDVRTLRLGVVTMARMMLAAGADYVTPGVHGAPEVVRDPAELAGFEESGPADPRAYLMTVTHMMGTARLGTDPATSVVNLDFEHHRLRGLWVADSSVFPGPLGVNPQNTMIAVAMAAAERIARRG